MERPAAETGKINGSQGASWERRLTEAASVFQVDEGKSFRGHQMSSSQMEQLLRAALAMIPDDQRVQLSDVPNLIVTTLTGERRDQMTFNVDATIHTVRQQLAQLSEAAA